MSGTKSGGKAAAITNIANHGDDFYRRIGHKGGSISRGGGFGQGEVGRERARLYGALGGSISRRGKDATRLTPSQVKTLKADFKRRLAYMKQQSSESMQRLNNSQYANRRPW